MTSRLASAGTAVAAGLLCMAAGLYGTAFAQVPPGARGGKLPPGVTSGPGGPGVAGPGSPFGLVPLTAADKGPIGPAPKYAQPMVGGWSVQKAENISTPGFTAAFKSRFPQVAQDIEAGKLPPYQSQCVPVGVPGMMFAGFNLEANAKALTIIAAQGVGIRIVLLDRKEHTAADKIFPSFQGDNTAHWEGRTLVVDTLGFDARNSLDWQVPLDDTDAHTVEHFRMKNPDVLEITTTLTSPKVLLKPWTYRYTYTRRAVVGNVPFCKPVPRS